MQQSSSVGRTLRFIATDHNEPQTLPPTSEIAKQLGVPRPQVTRAIAHLKRLGYAQTNPGKGGPVIFGGLPEILSRPPGEIKNDSQEEL